MTPQDFIDLIAVHQKSWESKARKYQAGTMAHEAMIERGIALHDLMTDMKRILKTKRPTLAEIEEAFRGFDNGLSDMRPHDGNDSGRQAG